MKKEDISSQTYENLTVLWPAWINEKGNQVWLCICSCHKQVRFLTTAQWKSRNRKSCGCKRVAVSRERTTAMNFARAGKPRSPKGKLASQAACKKMNRVRRDKARHILADVNPEKRTASCHVCGLVPIKIMRHRVGGERDQYLCWVGSLRINDDYAAAKVHYPNQALEMYQKQAHLCAICGRFMLEGNGRSGDGMVLDHCHKTGFIRGFVHQTCNHGIGHFYDEPETLRLAARYLENHQAQLVTLTTV